MLQNSDQCSFLRNNDNEAELISAKFPNPVIITEEQKTWHLSSKRIQELPSSNHVEEDNRIIIATSKNCDCQGY